MNIGLMFSFLGCFSSFPEKSFSPTLSVEEPAEIFRGSEGQKFNVGELIPFTLLIEDFDSGPQDILVTIHSNLDGILFEGTPDSEGSVAILDSSLQHGVHQIMISVAEGDHFLSETFMISINAVPTVSDIVIRPENPTTLDELYADVVSVQDPEGDEVELQIEWLLSGVEVGEQGVTLGADLTTKGERWTVRVTPSDFNGEGEAMIASVVIEDSLPQIDDIEIAPSDIVYNDQELQCLATASDADGDEFDLHYVWAIYDGSWIELDSGTEIFSPSPSIIQPGTRLYCGVMFNLESSIDEIEKTFIDVDNRNPVISDLAINANGTGVGSAFVCHASVEDPDQSPTMISFRWNNDTSGALIGGGDNLLATPQIASKGDQVTCVVTGEDVHGGEGEDSIGVIISNSPPSLGSAGVHLNPALPYITDDIECTAYSSDIDGDQITLSYTWTKNGIILAETGNTLLSGTYGDVVAGDQIRCQITPVDEDGLAGTTGQSAVIIQNSAPVLTSVGILNHHHNIFTDTLIVVMASVSDADGDNVSFSYDWLVNGGHVATTTTNSLDGLQYFSKGDTVEVEVTPIDEHSLEGSSMLSGPRTVLNSPPTAPEISFGNEYSHDDSDLYCEVITPSVDPDLDPISYNFQLTRDGVVPPYGVYSAAHTGDSVNSIATDISSEWLCTVRATDGIEMSTQSTSETLITACSFSEVYDIEEGFYDLSDSHDCWNTGVISGFPPASSIPFNSFVSDWDGSELNVFSYNSFESSKPKMVRNVETRTISYDDGDFPANVLALSPGDGFLNGFIEWTAPLDGTCGINLDFSGISPANTSSRVSLYHNQYELDATNVLGFLVPYSIYLEQTVVAGDVLTLVQEREPDSAGGMFPPVGHDWISIAGAIACTY